MSESDDRVIQNEEPNDIPNQGSAPAPYVVRVSPGFLVTMLAVVALALLFCHTALTIYHYQIEELPWLP